MTNPTAPPTHLDAESPVRARVVDSDGGTAWVQPYFLD